MQIRKGEAAAINTGLNPEPALAIPAMGGTAPGIRNRDVPSTNVSLRGDRPAALPQNPGEPDYRDSRGGAADKLSTSQPKAENTAALSTSINNQAVKDKIQQYRNNPKLQVQQLRLSVEDFYSSTSCPASLKSAYVDVNAAISTGIIPESRNLFSNTEKPFFRLMGAIGKMHSMLDKADKGINPIVGKPLIEFAECVCAAISPQLLLDDDQLSAKDHLSTLDTIDYMKAFESTGTKLMESASRCESNEERKQAFQVVGPVMPARLYGTESFSPVILDHPFSYEDSLFALSRGIFLLTAGRSERGVHGGSYYEPLVVMLHDAVHLHRFFPYDNEDAAEKLQGLASVLYKIIKDNPTGDQEKFFLMAHLMFHESDPFGMQHLGKHLNEPTEVFDFLYSKFDDQVQCETDLNLDLGGSLEWHKLYIDIFIKLKKDPSGYEGLNQRIRDNHKKLTDGSFRRGTPFAYDPISAILKLKSKSERDLLHKKLFPGVLQDQLPCFRDKIIDLRKKHELSDTDPPTDAYLHDLFLWKADSYNSYAGYKIIRDFMAEMKEKIYPSISEYI